MNKSLLFKLSNHYIYLVSSVNICFYIAIPVTTDKTKITINLLTEDIDSFMDVKDHILIPAFKELDVLTNNSLVIPIIDEKMNLDDVVAKVINKAYLVLKAENKNIDSQIILINNGNYTDFANSFIQRFANRCEYKTIKELTSNVTDYNKLETTSINFVIGKKDEIPKLEPEVEVKPDLVLDEIKLDDNDEEPEKSGGYVSYWLLGLISLVLIGAIIYVLI